MKIKRAEIDDLNQIMLMYSSCVNGMLLNDIDQWDETYPNKKVIEKDIRAESYFIATKNKEIVGGINIDHLQDEAYLTINWKDSKNLFLVVHRLAVKYEFWGDKIGKNLMMFAEKIVAEKNLNSIRLDTYSGNPIAINFYEKLGYKRLGDIFLKAGKNEYHCFEKILK